MPQSLTITRTPQSRLTEEAREQSPFGSVFSDHILLADYADGHWQSPAIMPYGPLPSSPAPISVHYGQALFEGFKAHRLVDGGLALFRPKDNYVRLNRGAARLAMPEVPAVLFMDGIAELVRLDGDWIPRRQGGALYVRPVFFATDEALPARPSSRYRFVVMTSPVGPYFAGAINLLAEERYVRAFPGGTGDIKSAGNYAGAILAALDAQAHGYHNVIWLDGGEHRYVEESGVMNVVFVIDGQVVTPPLNGAILPGVTRSSILTLLRDMKVTVEERPIRIDELFKLHAAGRLTEAAGVGTAATVAPIGRVRYRDEEIDLTPAGSDGILERVRKRLEAIRTGSEPDVHGWLMRL